jgi:sterol desaturase/sphingolipid hydroxylase (fatty acid hydroxylase superfamily)
MTPLLAAGLDFAVLLALVYAVTVAAYFALGAALSWLNARNPARRIQPARRGETRRTEEVRQSLVSILVTSASLAIGLFAQARGWAPAPLALTWWNALPLLVLGMILFDAWFYFAHRLLHTRALIRFHRPHHRSLAPTPWSNDAIGALDTALCQGYYAVIVFLVPLPPLVLIALRALDHVNGTFGHCGFEYFASRAARSPSPMLCTIYHDLHHSAFRYNYANFFSYLDRLFGTIHPDYDRRVDELAASAPRLRLGAGASP